MVATKLKIKTFSYSEQEMKKLAFGCSNLLVFYFYFFFSKIFHQISYFYLKKNEMSVIKVIDKRHE